MVRPSSPRPGWVSHLEPDRQSERFRGFRDAVADGYMLVRYDRFGVGLSDRLLRAADLTAEAARLGIL